MTWIDLVVMVAATWRLAFMVTSESGPRGAFYWIRQQCGARYEPSGELLTPDRGSLAEWITCVTCQSIWSAAIIYSLWLLPGGEHVVIVLAISGLAVAFHNKGAH